MSDIVKFTRQGEIGIVAVEEREFKNTFSSALVKGLFETFNYINNQNDLKVIVIHGYDNYFLCGGTKEELIKIFKKEITFNELSFHDILLECNIPVISAMQGHALGGGFALGSYADAIIMAEECVYSTNFMKYGFTPGFGSTFIVPYRYGTTLGSEMLFSAKNFYGRELKERGVGAKIVKKNEVINAAISLAKEYADKPMLSIKLLKKHLADKIREHLPKYIKLELAMHEKAFEQPEVQQRIEDLFGN